MGEKTGEKLVSAPKRKRRAESSLDTSSKRGSV